MTYRKTQKFLVAFRESDNKFFGLEETFATTSPRYVDHPVDAKLITPSSSDPEGVKEPAYYFENSSRMRGWLNGFRMVWVTLTSIAETA